MKKLPLLILVLGLWVFVIAINSFNVGAARKENAPINKAAQKADDAIKKEDEKIVEIVAGDDNFNIYDDISVKRRLEIENKLRDLALSQPYIISVITEKSSLTGFFIDKRGYALTSAHGFENYSSLDDETVRSIVLREKKGVTGFTGRLVGKIQTLDIALLRTLLPRLGFEVAQFTDLSKIVERGKYYSLSGNLEYLEKRMVVIRCYNKDKEGAQTDRIFIGEISRWRADEPVIEIRQEQTGSLDGCSGAPVININGEVIGMARGYIGKILIAVDAPTLQTSIKLLIEKDRENSNLE